MNDQERLSKLKRESLRVQFGHGNYAGQTAAEYVRRCRILRRKIAEVERRIKEEK